ncbi:unnamed protein product [Ilex paraguariensis]|uniref:Uncharacterized protein n=1 Tax=Ilex paraguariensis TaxID=185542 RepID=A0ABC8S4P7_9AQUA
MVTVEKSLTVLEQYDGRNERTTFEHSISVPITDARSKVRTKGVSDAQNVQNFDKRLSKVEVTLSEFRADHDALSAKFTVEVTEIKKMMETLSEKGLFDDIESEVWPDTTNEVVDALVPHITDVSDEVGNATLNYIFHEGLDAAYVTIITLAGCLASSSNVRKDLALKLVTHPHNTKRDEIIGKSLNLLEMKHAR